MQQRFQDAAEKRGSPLTEFDQQARESEGLAFAHDTLDPGIDRPAPVDQFVEPALQGLERAFDQRPFEQRPALWPLKHARVAEPFAGRTVDRNRQPPLLARKTAASEVI